MTELDRLKKENELLRVIYQTAAQSSLRFQDKIQLTLQKCLDEVGAKCAIVIRHDDKQSVPIISCNCVSFKDEQRQLAFKLIHEVCQLGKTEEKAFNISTIDLPILTELDPTHKGCATQPLWCDDKYIGVIAFFYRKTDTVVLGSETVSFLALIGDWIARAISNQDQANLDHLRQESVDHAEQSICWIDDQLTINYQNEAFKMAYGNNKEGLKITDLSENYTTESWQEHLEKCLSGKRVTVTDRMIGENKEPTHIEITLENIANSGKPIICCYVKDITIRTELQEKAELRETYFSNVLDKSPVGIVITASQSNIEFSNQAFQKMIGYSDQELKGQTIKDISLIGDYDGLIHDFINSDQRVLNIEKQYRRKDGSSFWAATNVGKIYMASNELTYVAFIQDITTRKADKNELKEANEELERFFYISTHDLKVPIANIQGFSQYLIDDELSDVEHVREQLHWIKSSADSGSKLLESLNKIAVARRNNEPDIDKEELILEEILDDIIIDHSTDIENSNTEFFIDIQKSEISARRVNLYSILQNLISNAIKYRSDQRSLLIKIESRQEKSNLVITVEDNGRGIDLQKYGNEGFNLFSRFHPGVEGSGLGLYLTKTLIKKEDGLISINSSPEKGTSFTLTFLNQYNN
jgi:PAS domain S-box-containing protein